MLNSGRKLIDIVYENPRTEEVFREYDQQTGTCVLCKHLFDTVDELAVQYDINLKELMVNLERAVFTEHKVNAGGKD